MTVETTKDEQQMTAQELAQFQKEYSQWCFEVELDRIKILNNKESRSE